MDSRILYSFPFFLSALLIFIVASFTFGRVKARGGWYLAILCLAASVWAITEGMLYLGLNMETNVLITKIQYLGIATVPPFALLFGLSVFGLAPFANRITRQLLFLIAAAIVLVVWTNPYHKLFFTGYYTIENGPLHMLGLKHGPVWWAVIIYHYLLTAVLSVVLLRIVAASSGYHRYQAGLILIAVTLVWITNAVYVSGNSPIPNMDMGPIAFVLVAGAMAWGFYRFKLLDILPVAKTEIFRGLDDMILVVDNKNRILDINPAAESIFKVRASQVIGRDASKAFEDYPKFQKVFGKTGSTEISLMQDGRKQLHDLRVSFITDTTGLKMGKIIALRDITDRIKAEKALLESEKRLRDQNNVIMTLSKVKLDQVGDLSMALKRISVATASTLNVARVSVWLYNTDCSKIECIELYDVSTKTHHKGMDLSSTNFPDYFNALREERTIAANDVLIDPRTIELVDSYLIPMGITSLLDSPIRISGQTIGVVCSEHTGPVRQWTMDEQTFSASIADMISLTIEAFERKKSEAEKKRLERQVQRAEKMEAIGTLAGGVAHDLNNILSGITSYPELLLLDIPEDSPLRRPILTIKKSGERASAIVNDLLTLARRGVSVTEVINLNHIISDYLKSPELKRLKSFHPDVRFETKLESPLMNIMGSPVHLSKTIMNLASNAVEAMPYGGSIGIYTENRYIDSPIKGYDQVKEGDYVVLSISDKGIGINPDEIESIFEPFYTKKVMGRSGTGLGMAVVWGTVKDHKGYIDVCSTEGEGTTFKLFFPVTRKTQAENKHPLPLDHYTGNGESILVVDDVEEQRVIATTILRKLRYTVSSAASGEEALTYMKNNTVDLVVLDMIMGTGMDGLDTYREMIDLHPHQKAIIASGFSETARVRKTQKLGAGSYVKKPYTLEKIGIAVKKELEKQD